MIFLKLVLNGEALAGDATTQGYERWIGIDSFKWSMSATHKPMVRNVRTELRPGVVRLSKVFDKATTVLFDHMMRQRQLDHALVVMVDTALRDSAEKPQKMLEMRLDRCFVHGIQASAEDAGRSLKIAEELELTFEGGYLEYFPDDAQSNRRPTGKTFEIPKILAS